MKRRKPLTDAEGEVRELTAADMKLFKPAAQVLPPAVMRMLTGRGPQKSKTKAMISIRLSRDVVDTFRASGEGWQTRIDAALKDWLKTHRPAP